MANGRIGRVSKPFNTQGASPPFLPKACAYPQIPGKGMAIWDNIGVPKKGCRIAFGRHPAPAFPILA
jgi:hypothetical protein